MYTILSILFSLGWLWDDMTKGPSQIATTAALALLLIHATAIKSLPSWAKSLLLVVASGLEIHSLAKYNYSSWMFASFGDFAFGVCVSIGAMLMIALHFMLMKDCLQRLAVEGNFNHYFSYGAPVIIIAITLIVIVGLIDDDYVIWIFGSYLIFQVAVSGHAILSAYKNQSDMKWALLAGAVYIMSYLGMLCLFVHFGAILIALSLFGLIGAIALKIHRDINVVEVIIIR